MGTDLKVVQAWLIENVTTSLKKANNPAMGSHISTVSTVITRASAKSIRTHLMRQLLCNTPTTANTCSSDFDTNQWRLICGWTHLYKSHQCSWITHHYSHLSKLGKDAQQ